MKRTTIKDIYTLIPQKQEILVMGWVKTFRNNRFVSLNDGSTIRNMQIVINGDTDTDTFRRITTGACIAATGNLMPSLGKGQSVEIQATKITILGDSDGDNYPLQPKKHSLEFLREMAHLRARTTTFGAIMRIRHRVSFAIHQFFHDRNFFYVHTPIITGMDAEGGGAMFRVTTIDASKLPSNEPRVIDYHQDFFNIPTYLTVSGQLEAESYALALGNTYTFGPTFRAENSNTTRHLAEFWMVEPEMAFYNLHDTMRLAQDFLQFLIRYVLKQCSEDLDFLSKRHEEEEKKKPQNQRANMSLKERMEEVAESTFQLLTYTEAIDILRNCSYNKKKKFVYPITEWGIDLQSEHERFLVEKHFKKPVIVYDYPEAIKAFYMRKNDDGKTVAAMDILFPGIGEIIGGSQREERYQTLKERMQTMNISEGEMKWYLELRQFGSAPHSGFGLGVERFLSFVTGMANIRDVIPFPRYPGNARF